MLALHGFSTTVDIENKKQLNVSTDIKDLLNCYISQGQDRYIDFVPLVRKKQELIADN